MTAAANELASAAERAGFDDQGLQLVTELVLGWLPELSELTDHQLTQVRAGLEVCVQAGFTPATLAETVNRVYLQTVGVAGAIADDETADDERAGVWRQRFWERDAWPRAKRRYNRPDLWGLSPLEDDPFRIALWGSTEPARKTA